MPVQRPVCASAAVFQHYPAGGHVSTYWSVYYVYIIGCIRVLLDYERGGPAPGPHEHAANHAANHADQETPGPPPPWPRFPILAESGNGRPRGPRRFPIPPGPVSKKQGFPDSRVTSINCSGLGIYSAASIMPVLSQAACGSYSGSERGNVLPSSASRDCATLLAEVGTWLSLALMSCTTCFASST